MATSTIGTGTQPAILQVVGPYTTLLEAARQMRTLAERIERAVAACPAGQPLPLAEDAQIGSLGFELLLALEAAELVDLCTYADRVEAIAFAEDQDAEDWGPDLDEQDRLAAEARSLLVGAAFDAEFLGGGIGHAAPQLLSEWHHVGADLLAELSAEERAQHQLASRLEQAGRDNARARLGAV